MADKAYQPSSTRYEQIPYRRCGASGLKLPLVSLGLWHNFGGQDDPGEMKRMLCGAFDLGITHFDLANNYGPPPGSAELAFGKILKEQLGGYRDELIISSKAGYGMWPGPYGEWGTRKYLLASLDQSLQRIGVDYVDIFYSHRFDPHTPLEETMGALDTAVRQGKALYAGISSYSPSDTARAGAILKRLGTPCLIHQPNYNLLDRWVEHGLLDTLEKEGMGCITFCPLAQGLLSPKYLGGVPEGSRAAKVGTALDRAKINADLVERLNALNQIAQRRGQTLAQMALTWIVKDPRITSVVIGASRLEQIQQNVKGVQAERLSTDELAAIDRIITPEVLTQLKSHNLWVDY